MNNSRHPNRGWLERSRTVNGIVYALYAACALSVLLEFAVHRDETLDFANWFAFHAWFGFVACVGLVLAAKGLRRLLMRSEDYYGESTEDGE